MCHKRGPNAGLQGTREGEIITDRDKGKPEIIEY